MNNDESLNESQTPEQEEGLAQDSQTSFSSEEKAAGQNQSAGQGPEEKPSPSSRKKRKSGKSSAVVYGLLGGIIGSGLLLTGQSVYSQWQASQPRTSITAKANPSASATQTVSSIADDATVTAAIQKVQDAVVSIANYQYSSSSSSSSLADYFSNNGGNSATLQKASEGSGVIYKVENGYAYIVTNNHVIADAKELNVTFADGTTTAADLVGADSLTDLAVLRIKSDHVTTVANFANSDDVKVGETALAIGSPLGSQLASTVTKGIVSAVNRSVEVDTNNDNVKDWTMETIQTDAAINPGNSGGALIDLNGNVIGINSMKIASESVEGIGFAIPSNQVVDIINQLETQGKITRPVLGVGLVDLSNISNSQRTSLLNLPSSVTSGVVVGSVQSGSSADKAGLQKYDVIVSVDGQDVTDTLSLRKALYKHNVGDSVTISFYRNGSLQTATVTLSASNSL